MVSQIFTQKPHILIFIISPVILFNTLKLSKRTFTTPVLFFKYSINVGEIWFETLIKNSAGLSFGTIAAS